jgi:hypothetical protein
MSEAVEILLSVDDQASKAVATAAKNVTAIDRDAMRATPKIISLEKAGRTAGDAVGRIGDLLDVPELNRASGAIGGIAEQLQLAKESASGIKLGFVGTLGVAGGVFTAAVGIGKAIGDIVFQTSAWEQKLESALSISKQLEDRRSRTAGRAFEDDLAFMELRGAGDDEYLAKIREIRNEAQGIGASIASELAAADRLRESMVSSFFQKALIQQFEASAGVLQSQLEQLKEQETTLQRMLTVERDLTKERERKSRLDSEDRYIKQLREELELITASADEQDRIIAFRNAATIDGQAEIELLLRAKRQAENQIAKAVEKSERVKGLEKPRAMDRPTNLDGFESRLLTRGPAQDPQKEMLKVLQSMDKNQQRQTAAAEQTSQDISKLIRNPVVIGAPGGRR